MKVLDPTTVQIVCSQPKADMEASAIYILPKHIWQNVSPQAAIRLTQHPPVIGSGPFETVKWVKGSYLEMVRNPYYSGPNRPSTRSSSRSIRTPTRWPPT